MVTYLFKRLLLVIPTLFGILLLNFMIIQAAPGGPVDQMIAKLRGNATEATARFSGAGSENMQSLNSFNEGGASNSKYLGAQGLDPEFIAKLEKMFGFDQPPLTRFCLMLKNYVTFDFGNSYFKDRPVIELIKEKLPVSISIGLWTTLLIYLISIPLGIQKAVRDGSPFDIWSSVVVVVGFAIPSFLFAILLIVLFAGGSFWSFFPLRGLVSDNWHQLPLGPKILDYFWHITLPIFALVISGFASLTLLTKNSFLEEINKQYVITARAKGLTERRVLFGHVFRNAMLIVVAGIPAALIHVFLTGSILIEGIFSLDGLGLLGYESAINRDYPVVFASLYIFTLVGLFLHIISDIIYVYIDPRIDFEKRIG